MEIKESENLVTSSSNPSLHPYDDGETFPSKFNYVMSLPALDQETVEKYSWNPEDCSSNMIFPEKNLLKFHRNPVPHSTDAIRCKVGFSRGFHVWQIGWPLHLRGTNATIGVATKEAPLHQIDYVSLIGETKESYGWEISRSECNTDRKNMKSWKYPTNIPLRFTGYHPPEHIYCMLDMEEGYLAFATEDKFHGVAFRGLKGKTLYPAVGSVYGHCEVSIKYIGGLDRGPSRLIDICRHTILLQMGKGCNRHIKKLPLPNCMKEFLLQR